MKFAGKIYRFAGSYQFSAYVLIAAITFYTFLAIWATRIPNSWVVNIADLWSFRLLYILLFVNMILCSINRFGPALKTWRDETGWRKRLKPWGSICFHLAFLMIPAGYFTSFPGHFTGQFVLMEGQPFTGKKVEYVSIQPEDTRLSMYPVISFTVDDVKARFWSGGFLFEELIASCTMERNGKSEKTTIELNRPYRMGATMITLSGYGWSPVYRLESPVGTFNGAVNLKVFPSGNEDGFSIAGTPYQITLKIWSDYILKDGKNSSASFELKNPVIEVTVSRSKLEVYKGLLKPGERAYFEKSNLVFTEIREQGNFRVIRDYGRPFLWVGYILALAGLAVRFV